MPKAVVFASGRGSNFIAIHRLLKNSTGNRHEVAALVSDRPGCGAVAYAETAGIPVVLAPYQKGRDRGDVERAVLEEFSRRGITADLIVFAGFMRLVSPVLIDAFPRKIVNIHPSLLPRHPGAHGIEESYASGDEFLGITIHYVDYGMDTGPIIMQRSFARRPGESLADIEARIHALEHAAYPETVLTLLDAAETELEEQT